LGERDIIVEHALQTGRTGAVARDAILAPLTREADRAGAVHLLGVRRCHEAHQIGGNQLHLLVQERETLSTHALLFDTVTRERNSRQTGSLQHLMHVSELETLESKPKIRHKFENSERWTAEM